MNIGFHMYKKKSFICKITLKLGFRDQIITQKNEQPSSYKSTQNQNLFPKYNLLLPEFRDQVETSQVLLQAGQLIVLERSLSTHTAWRH